MSEPAEREEVIPFLHVDDLERSLRFYVDGLGFEVRDRWEVEGRLRWCRLERRGVSLMLQSRAPGASGPGGSGISIVIFCHDARARYRELRGRGLAPSLPFVGNGLWVTTLVDPDGYRVDIESPADAPEDTVHDEP